MDKNCTNDKDNNNINIFERIKERFFEDGFAGFTEKEIVEIVLSYCIPQIDVVPIATRLLNKFRTLKRILDASIEDLLEINGIIDKTAILLKLVAGMTQYYYKQNFSEIIRLDNQIASKKFCVEELSGSVNEELLVVCLNANGNVIGTKRFTSRSETHVDVSVRQITSYVLRNNCKIIIIAHNHPVTPPNPSVEDLSTTSMIISNCILNDINVLDHIICSPYGEYSLAEHLILANIKRNSFNCLKYTEDSATYVRFCSEDREYKIL
jgi:DNA repair protein RadC